MCNEIWKPTVDIEGYEVSNLGRVRSFKQNCKGLILKPRISRWGYQHVRLAINNDRKIFSVHKLVALAFIPNPLNKPCVNHINGIKTDNRVENLEWVTYAENISHAISKGLIKQGEANYHAKLTDEQARYIRENPARLTQKELGREFNVPYQVIYYIQLGKTYKSAGGKIRKAWDVPSRIPDAVREEIKRLYIKGSREFGLSALAKRFGVHIATIWRIIHESETD